MKRIIGFLVLLFWSLSATAGDTREALEALWKRHVEVERAWHARVDALVRAADPGLAEISAIVRDLHDRQLVLRGRRLKHLLATDPERITASQDPSEFANFFWTTLDDMALEAGDPDYARLLKEVKALRKRQVFHARKDDYRRLVRQLRSQADWQAALAERRAALKEIALALGRHLEDGAVAAAGR